MAAPEPPCRHFGYPIAMATSHLPPRHLGYPVAMATLQSLLHKLVFPTFPVAMATPQASPPTLPPSWLLHRHGNDSLNPLPSCFPLLTRQHLTHTHTHTLPNPTTILFSPPSLWSRQQLSLPPPRPPRHLGCPVAMTTPNPATIFGISSPWQPLNDPSRPAAILLSPSRRQFLYPLPPPPGPAAILCPPLPLPPQFPPSHRWRR